MDSSGFRSALVAALIALAGVAQAGEDEFLEGLAQVDRTMEQGQWERAEQSLFELLQAHPGQAYVLLRQNRLEDRLRECAFRADTPDPDPSAVISGELLSYDARSGKLKLEYDLAAMREERERLAAEAEAKRQAESEGDTGGLQDDDAEAEREAPSGLSKVWLEQFSDLFSLMFDADWEFVDGVPVHPLVFDGSYTVEIEGVMPTDEGDNQLNFAIAQPRMVVRLSDNEWFNFNFGSMGSQSFGTRLHFAASATHWLNGKGSEVDEYSRPLFEPREPYSVKLVVGSSSISGSANGKSVLKAKKPKDEWGRFGFGQCPGVTTITITGTASPAWLKSKIDAFQSRERRAFNEDYDVVQALPSWLAELPRGAERDPNARYDDVPGPFNPSHAGHLEKLAEFRRKNDFDEALEYLEELEGGKASPEFKLYHRVLLQLLTERHVEANAGLDTLLAMVPTFLRGKTLQARVRAQLGDVDGAKAALTALIAEAPEQALPREALTEVLLANGDRNGAKQTVHAAILAGVPPAELRRAQILVESAYDGPRWTDASEANSGNYTVRTDVESRLATLAARHLDESLPMYERVLGVPLHRSADQRVFLFAGASGLADYQRDAFGSVKSTLGLYSPELRQLLIRNLPDEAQLLSLLQHEGWHQYLSVLGVQAPPWFDEGVAEYVGSAEESRRGLQAGKPRSDFVESLTDSRWVWTPLEELLKADRYAWRQNSRHFQPEAWALVHTLLSTEDPATGAFQALSAKLAGGESAEAASAGFLEQVDPGALLERVKRHTRDLR